MHRQILAYIPANVIPALTSVLMIYVYTRLLNVKAYGDYTLAFSAVMVAQATLFTPLSVGVVRLFPMAEKAGTVWSFLKTAYGSLALIGLGIGILVLPAVALLPTYAPTVMFIVTFGVLLLLRGLVTLNQSVNRMRGADLRFNIVECGQAILGLGIGIALVMMLRRPAWDGIGVMAGLCIGTALCAAIDIRLLASSIGGGKFDRKYLADLTTFGLPLAGTFLTSFLLQYADRFVVGALSGTAAVAVYAVAYSLVERPTTLLCTSISTATFPMAVRALEDQGVQAGRIQAGRNGAMLIGLVVPACIGLALTASNIANQVVGPDYRDGVAALIPIMAVTAALRGVSVHFVEHAFHLARRPMALLSIYGPIAALNVLLCTIGVYFLGMKAAAWISLACQCGVLFSAWLRGRRYFPLWLPWLDIACVFAASALMATVLLAMHFPETVIGLGLTVGTGCVTYAIVLALLIGLRRLASPRRLLAPPLAEGNR